MYSLVGQDVASKDKYKMYQKEAQIISIKSGTSSVVVSVPALKPNFF